MAELTGNNANQRGQDEHDTKTPKTKKVSLFGYDTVNDVNRRISSKSSGSEYGIVVLNADGSSVGGGTQYTEGDIDATITGSAIMWEDAADTLRAVSAAKPLPVDITDTSLPVTQSGTWTVQPGNTANTTAWKVDGSAVTQPVSGTFWQATQPVSGTVAFSNTTLAVTNAGTFATQATIAAGATNIAKAEDAPSADADVGVPSMAIRKGTPANTSGLDGDYEMLQMAAGRLWTSSTIDAALPAGDAVVGRVKLTDGTNVASVRDTGASDSLNVAIVDAAGGQITTFGGGTEYTEDAIAPADPVGSTLMMTRDDSLAAVTEIEGDWSRLRGSAKGALWVTIPDVNGDPITSFGGGTQYTEDVASAADPIGNMLIGRRRDVLVTNEVTTEGDNIALNATNKGQLHVKLDDTITVAAHAVTNAGTFATQVDGAALTALQLIDDTVAVLGTATYTEASTKGNIIGAVRRDANTSLVDTTNEVAPLQVNATGELKVAQIQALPAGTNNIGDVDIVTVPADPFGVNADVSSATGSISAKLRAAATALEIIDDWDETDRAKVNSIVGQAGVAAGAGTDSAATQRVTPSTGATSTLTNVADVATSTTLLSAAATRRKFIIFNDSSADCYVKYGTTASTTSFTWLLPASGHIEEEHYNGRVDAIWASDASGSARITEIT